MSHSGKKKSHSYNFCLYSAILSSLTGGSATFQMKFAEYVQVPADVQTKLLAEYAAQEQEED